MFVIFTESARAAEPGKGAFDDPAPRQDLEAMECFGMLDDFQTRATSRAQGAQPLVAPQKMRHRLRGLQAGDVALR